MHTITDNLGRISFHDSSIEKTSRSFNKLALHFDWAKIQNYGNDSNPIDIVVGECYLILSGVTSELFLKHQDTLCSSQVVGPLQVHVPIDIETAFSLIGHNEFSTTTYRQVLSLSGMYEGVNGIYWLEQQICFQTGCFYWNNYVTLSEWWQGSIPK